MTSINPYLNFNGNTEEVFNFYRSAFGGEFLYIGRYKDVPHADKASFKIQNDNKIMHVTLPISKETLLMGCDDPAGLEPANGLNTNISLSINTGSKEEADRLFNKLSIGGQIKMPMNQTFWGSYFGMFTDQFGINWMISFEYGPIARLSSRRPSRCIPSSASMIPTASGAFIRTPPR